MLSVEVHTILGYSIFTNPQRIDKIHCDFIKIPNFSTDYPHESAQP